jgi:hypothetical protein
MTRHSTRLNLRRLRMQTRNSTSSVTAAVTTPELSTAT